MNGKVDDLINRSKAIRWIKAECNPYGQPTLDYESGIKVIKYLERMPSAQSEPCGDMISKEYLKEHIEACWINSRPRYAPELNELLSWIDDVPSAQHEQRWISCSERLPKEDEQVLVYLYGDCPYFAWIDYDGHWTTNDFEIDKEDEPVAWMPLPKPYQKDGD